MQPSAVAALRTVLMDLWKGALCQTQTQTRGQNILYFESMEKKQPIFGNV